MSLFRGSLYGADPSFTPLFRLLDDFDSYSREVQGDNSKDGNRRVQAVRTFNPKFDVRETETTYELHGELAGIDRENVNIEFTEPQTLIIRGKVERSYTLGTPGQNGASASHPHKVTVEEATEDGKEKHSTEVAKTGDKHLTKTKAPAAVKYWVSERSIGEFSRTFSFPSQVDQENVSANLNNGILSVVVPKAKKQGVRRVAIN